MDKTIMKVNKNAITVVAGSTIRYRRSLNYREKYRIMTNLAFFDEKNVYVEQKFISEKDDFVSAIAYVKAATIGLKPIDLLKLHFGEREEAFKLECPKELKAWIDYHNISSETLKAESQPTD